MAGGLKLAPLLTEIKVDIAGFKSEMGKAASIGVAEADKISSRLATTAKVGESFSRVGATLTKGVTLPIAGIAIATGKMAVDFESDFAKVSTLLDSNVVNFGKYKNEILDASSESKIAVEEFSEAVYQSISAGVDQTKAIDFTSKAMKLAKGGFTDGAKAVDILTTAINAYGLEASDVTKVSDMLVTTQNLGKTTVDELASSMGKVIPTANSYNVNLGNVSSALATLTKNGIATAEATTYYNGMLNELGSAGTKADEVLRGKLGKGFAELQAEGVPLTDCLKTLKDSAEESGKSLGDMFGSSEASKAALTIMKDNGVEYNSILEQMENSAGATQAAFEMIDETPAERMTGALNRLKNEGIKLGQSFVPVVEKVADVITGLATKFSGLTDEQRMNLVKWGALAMAIGPVMSVVGGGISTFTKVSSVLGGMTKAISLVVPAAGVATKAVGATASAAGTVTSAISGGGGLLTSLGGLAATAGPVALAVAGIGAAGYVTYKALTEEAVPAVDLFANAAITSQSRVDGAIETTTVKISENTRKQIQSYMDLSNSVQQETTNMYVGAMEITDQNIAAITEKVGTMSSQIVGAVETQKTEVVAGFTDMFTKSTEITTAEQTNILSTITTSFDQRVQKTRDLETELVSILTSAADSGKEITTAQQIRVNEIYEEMKTQAVASMSQNEAEQNVIMNRLKDSNGRVSAEMASNAIKEMEKQRKSTVSTASKERDERVYQIELMRNELEKQGKGTADELIKSANRQYKETVDAAQKTKDEGIDKLGKSYKNLSKDVDTNTGKILSAWDKVKAWWNQWDPPTKTLTVNERQNIKSGITTKGFYRFNGVDNVPYDGYQAVLHKNERVLTAEENKSYSNSAKPENRGIQKPVVVILQVDGKEITRTMLPHIDTAMGDMEAMARRGAI